MIGVPQYSATTALPYPHRERATAGLRAELRHHLRAGEQADWATLAIAGPKHVPDARGRTWFEYVATVQTRSPDGGSTTA
jgi:hypothetical protein